MSANTEHFAARSRVDRLSQTADGLKINLFTARRDDRPKAVQHWEARLEVVEAELADARAALAAVPYVEVER